MEKHQPFYDHRHQPHANIKSHFQKRKNTHFIISFYLITIAQKIKRLSYHLKFKFQALFDFDTSILPKEKHSKVTHPITDRTLNLLNSQNYFEPTHYLRKQKNEM